MDLSGGVLSMDEWRAKARLGKAPEGVVLRKQYVPDAVKAEEGDSRRVSFTISTGAADRDRDVLKVEGWRLDSYRKNPVVLWAHQYAGLPVAKAESVMAKAGVLKATATFASPEDYPFAETVYRMLKGGFLRATSVGFRPLKHAFNDERMGFDFEEQELLEFSIVPVPANADALMDAKAAGVDVGPLKAWAEGVLDGMEPGIWVPKSQALEVFKALSETRVSVPAFDPEPVVAEFSKRGRVLSSQNEQRIRSARDASGAIAAALDEVLAYVDEDEDEDEKEKGARALYVSREPAYLVDPAAVKAVMQAAVSEAVREQVNHARGRLD